MKRFLEQNSAFLILLLCFGIFRTAVADWNTVPSGSMRPTILEGDVVLVNRVAYDLKVPLTDIALPGDVVEMRDEVLFINGKPAEYGSQTQVTERMESGGTTTGVRTTERIAGSERTIQFLPQLNAARSFGPYVVPKDHYFFLGDGRPDLRYIGQVPRRLLIGHANHIVVSADILGNWMPRLGRTGEPVR